MNRNQTLCAILLAAFPFTGLADAQPFRRALKDATDVIVADCAQTTGDDDGHAVTMRGTLQVVRVLKGEIQAGTEVAINWQFEPGAMDGPPFSATIPAGRDLWFLRRTDSGYEPLRLGSSRIAVDGFRMRVPVAAHTNYASDIPFETKVGWEIVGALEDINPAKLAKPPVRDRTAYGIWMDADLSFRFAQGLLYNLPPDLEADVYARLTGSQNVYLKALGLARQISAGDTEAAVQLERTATKLAPALNTVSFIGVGDRFPYELHLDGARALARAAVGETEIPLLEAGVATRLGSLHQAEFLPFLITFLESPDPLIRFSALESLCIFAEVNQPAPFCPNGSTYLEPATERVYIEHWNNWWDTQRATAYRTVDFPVVTPPARYHAAQQIYKPLPVENRFRAVLRQFSSESSGLTEFSSTDLQVLRDLASTVRSRMNDIDRRLRVEWSAARLAGKPVTVDRIHALSTERDAMTDAAMADAKARVSPECWDKVQALIEQAAASY